MHLKDNMHVNKDAVSRIQCYEHKRCAERTYEKTH